jgi:hypothetical protein
MHIPLNGQEMGVYQDHFRDLFQASVLEIDAVKNFGFDTCY